jgi:hypothetical protein
VFLCALRNKAASCQKPQRRTSSHCPTSHSWILNRTPHDQSTIINIFNPFDKRDFNPRLLKKPMTLHCHKVQNKRINNSPSSLSSMACISYSQQSVLSCLYQHSKLSDGHGDWDTNSYHCEVEGLKQYFLQDNSCCSAVPFEHSRDWSWENTYRQLLNHSLMVVSDQPLFSAMQFAYDAKYNN